jgi:hypothetical protein
VSGSVYFLGALDRQKTLTFRKGRKDIEKTPKSEKKGSGTPSPPKNTDFTIFFTLGYHNFRGVLSGKLVLRDPFLEILALGVKIVRLGQKNKLADA